MLGDFASLEVQNTYRGSDAYDENLDKEWDLFGHNLGLAMLDSDITVLSQFEIVIEELFSSGIVKLQWAL
ncbi:hypothetical protein [Piscirickettsia salmonis]|uniref:hypothetical protein n=1 Tax=Piscirickettsia salmonis TaxID=1238 RepID=UPI003A811F0C